MLTPPMRGSRKSVRVLLLALVGFSVVVVPIAAQDSVKLVASNGDSFDNFGHAVSASANAILVGARLRAAGLDDNVGAGYVFRRQGVSWVEEASLVPAGTDDKWPPPLSRLRPFVSRTWADREA